MKGYTVSCYDHGPMARDEPRFEWYCFTCGRKIGDEEVYRLVKRAPEGSPDPLPIVVT